ncbi:class I SAM-dependent methyltransferase [Rhizobium oryzicola]|uniref:Class I SAM-dependent methyltransferase n=1 Tax=Rhizobium oryzicola TaxID=1232668 RepID=A0ABT8T4F2_9HYPH|nr:class I SAM-dependent methyltransferase [Rhizobium oryzicola]MDO1585445.1 class I SAM-dependent methyltransferase [Rhizobium oryzicola]
MIEADWKRIGPYSKAETQAAGRSFAIFSDYHHYDSSRVDNVPKIFDVKHHNSVAWDFQSQQDGPWSRPVSRECIAAARKGDWRVHLTPSPLPHDWLGDITNKDILCLASAGGQQAPVLAAAGANVTVFDLSGEQLHKDEMVARRDGLPLVVAQGDMCDLSRFVDASFHLVLHPISNQYVCDIQPVWNECYRVLRKGGALLSSFFNPAVFISDRDPHFTEQGLIRPRFPTPYSDIRDLDEAEIEAKLARREPLIFGHDMQSQIGGQLAAGFMLAGFLEEMHPNPRFEIEKFIPSFIATRSIKLR